MSLFYRSRALELYFAIALCLNIALWFTVRDVEARWTNVPPPPAQKFAAAYGLGDAEFAYRLNGLMIQNMGDTGGKSTPLKNYDYNMLTRWFFLQDFLDPRSDFTPYLVSYYFGAVQEPEKFRPVLDYLEMVGARDYGEKWRWLAQAVFLARYNMEDTDKALELANILAQNKNKKAPAWVRQMPAFVMTARGEKEAAYVLLLEILKSSAEKLNPNEVRATRAYICTRILEPDAAKTNPLCENLE